ncbi:MAG: VanZ family protein [Phycisphaeraceae bacterium]
MNDPPPSNPEPPPEPPEPPPWPPPGTGRWLGATFGVAVAILLVQLYPYDFAAGGSLYALQHGGYLNVLGQVALFVPLGLVETQLVRRLLTGAGGVLVLLVTLDGVLLSLVCETVQFWLPARTSSIVDLAANTLGVVVGYKLALLMLR